MQVGSLSDIGATEEEEEEGGDRNDVEEEDNGMRQQDDDDVVLLNRRRITFRNKTVVVLIGTVILVLVILDACTNKRLEAASGAFVEWVAIHPTLGVFAVILVYMIATICFVPGSILTIGTGYAFGRAFRNTFLAVALSSAAVFIGASLGSLCCLFLGRYLFRESVLRLADNYPIMMAVDRALEHNGFRIMLLLRLSPLIPYNTLDYLSGVTSISVRHYSMALVGLLPGGITLSYVGATASSLAEGRSKAMEDGVMKNAALIFGLFFALAGGAVAAYYSKMELDRILDEQPSGQLLSSDASLISEESLNNSQDSYHGIEDNMPPPSSELT